MSEKKSLKEHLNLPEPSIQIADLLGTGHLFIGKKGGAGKTFSANIFAQYLKSMYPRHNIRILDLDPMNTSLSQTEGLHAERLELTENMSMLIASRMDEAFLPDENSGNEIRIMDMGSNGYLELLQHVTQTNVPEVWEAAGHRLFLHTPLCGGGLFRDTLEALGELSAFGEKCPIFIWNNCRERMDGVSDMLKFLQEEIPVREELKNYGKFYVPKAIDRTKVTIQKTIEEELRSRIFRYAFYSTSMMKRVIDIGIRENASYITETVEYILRQHLTFQEVFDGVDCHGKILTDPALRSPGQLMRLKKYLVDPHIGVFLSIQNALESIDLGFPPVTSEPLFSPSSEEPKNASAAKKGKEKNEKDKDAFPENLNESHF